MKTKLYVISSNSDIMWFEEKWCDECIRRSLNPDAKKQCVNNLLAYAGEKSDKWIIQDGQPVCTAFSSRVEHNRKRAAAKTDPRQQSIF